jgi:DNA polymerase
VSGILGTEERRWRALGLGPRWVERPARDREEPAHAVPDGAAPDALISRGHEATAGTFDAPAPPSRVGSGAPVRPTPDGVALLDWEPLQARVAGCTACGLCATRSQTVFGVGRHDARWMIVGEAPGAEEDARGEPFVGQAGRLLDNMLASIGVSRAGATPQDSAYIANVLKCRPPGNRNPTPDEVARCEPFLARQLELLQPRVVLVMGRFAAQALLGTEASIASLRGTVHACTLGARRTPAVVTYHPAYLLRNLADKSKAWADLCLARAACVGPDDRT